MTHPSSAPSRQADAATNNEKVSVESDGDVLVITIRNPPINAGSLAVRRGVLAGIARLSADDALVAGVIIGGGATFIAGSDLREFGRPLEDPQLPSVIAAIEACPKPVLAAIHGAALGGGFELALGCDARIATRQAVVGLPEVTLGMTPGAGGTQRLPRIVGCAKAIGLVCSGERVETATASELGIIDAIADADLREAAVAFARGMKGKRRLRDEAPKADAPEAVEAAVQAALQAAGERPWVKSAIDRVLAAQSEPIDEALNKERALFQQYRQAPEAAALRHLFFAEREAARHPMPIESSSLIGKRVDDACRRQCERLLAEGATPAQIDHALQAFGFAMEPFGREEPGVLALLERASAESNLPRREVTDAEIVRRALMAMVNEAAHLLSEGVAARASDIDVTLVHGHGFPRWEGGPVCLAQRLGREALEIELDQLAAASGAGFRRADTHLLFGEGAGAATR